VRGRQLWADFRSEESVDLRGEGTELEPLAAKLDLQVERMFRKFERRHEGIALYPRNGWALKLRARWASSLIWPWLHEYAQEPFWGS
jgi:hypothetical protein